MDRIEIIPHLYWVSSDADLEEPLPCSDQLYFCKRSANDPEPSPRVDQQVLCLTLENTSAVIAARFELVMDANALVIGPAGWAIIAKYLIERNFWNLQKSLRHLKYCKRNLFISTEDLRYLKRLEANQFGCVSFYYESVDHAHPLNALDPELNHDQSATVAMAEISHYHGIKI